MASRDLKNRIKPSSVINPAAAKTSTTTATSVDAQGYESVTYLVQNGVVTDGTHTPSIEESDSLGSGYSAVAAADLIGSFSAITSATTAGTVQRVGYRGGKRYTRLVVTVSGATSGGFYTAQCVLAHPRRIPTT